MLLKSQLKKPFTEKPLIKLHAIPVYNMSSYLDKTMSSLTTNDQPKWLLSGEDSMFLDSFCHDKSLENDSENKSVDDNTYVLYPTKDNSSDFFEIPEANELEFYLTIGDEKSKEKEATTSIAFETLNEKPTKDMGDNTLEDNSLMQKFEMIGNDFDYSLLKTPFVNDLSKERALVKKLEFLEKKMEVESMKIHQQHDVMVKKILARKNNEMNEIKSVYQKKIAELEITMDARDQTISNFNMKLNEMQVQQGNVVKELKDEIERKDTAMKGTTVQIKNMEVEMKNLRRSHFEHVERLVLENESNILKVKEKFMNEASALNEKCLKLNEDLKVAEEMKNAALQEKDECLAKEEENVMYIKQLQMDIVEMNSKLKYMECENLNFANEKQNLKNDLNVMKSEAQKSNKTIASLQLKIEEFRNTVENLECNKQAEVKDLKLRTKEKMMEFESSLKKKKQTLQKDFDAKEAEYKRLLEQLSVDINKKDKEIRILNDTITKQSLDTKQALARVKKFAEEKIFKIHEDLNLKHNRLNASIIRLVEKLNIQKCNVKHHYDSQRQSYEAKHLEYKCHVKDIHSKLQGKHNVDIMQYTEKLAKQRLEYEEKLKGLLPLHVKNELQNTIESMKEQIDLLQSQTAMLRD